MSPRGASGAITIEPGPPILRPEREETDQSLRTERENTDRALAERRKRIEKNADEVVESAREHADAVLESARDRADEKLDSTRAGLPARDAVARERAREDEAVRAERTAADEVLRSTRAAQTRTLAALLPLEREKTDLHLLTERSRSDDALAHRDDFLSIVSHDLRNILGGMAASVTLLARQASDSAEGRRTATAMERIQRYIARMNRLVGDLVDVASIDAGKLSMHPHPCDAGALLREAVNLFVQGAKAKGVVVEADTGTAPLNVVCDAERVLQVVANLIANAVKFSTPGGSITVRGELAEGELRVSVLDTGIGIAEDMLEAVFERFWQVGQNDQRGLGLGLYISRSIVCAHGGRISAQSTLGEGSAFRFTIPCGTVLGT